MKFMRRTSGYMCILLDRRRYGRYCIRT